MATFKFFAMRFIKATKLWSYVIILKVNCTENKTKAKRICQSITDMYYNKEAHHKTDENHVKFLKCKVTKTHKWSTENQLTSDAVYTLYMEKLY